MTYSSGNFYRGGDACRSSGRSGADDSQAFRAASRKAAAAVERTRLAAGAVAETYAYWRSVRETTRQLSLLDDAALRDIGLDRSQIMEVARRLAQKKCRTAAGRARPLAD